MMGFYPPPSPLLRKGSRREVSRRLGVKLLAFSQFAHSSWVRILGSSASKTKSSSSDDEPLFVLRADDGIRTHDINLGKVALYH